MPSPTSERAHRQRVEWPARIRPKGQAGWRNGRVINLSVTGALLRVDHHYPLGECVEVEIDFLTQAESQTVVAGNGYVVRNHAPIPNSTAVQFDTECTIAQRQGAESAQDDAGVESWRGPGSYRASLALLA